MKEPRTLIAFRVSPRALAKAEKEAHRRRLPLRTLLQRIVEERYQPKKLPRKETPTP